MTPTQQKIAAAALGVVCAAVWGPQVLQKGRGSSAAQSPAGPSQAEMDQMMTLVDELPAGDVGADPRTAAPFDSAPRAARDPRADLDTLVSTLQNFGVGAPPRSLDQVALDWSRRTTVEASAKASGDEAVELDELDEFLAANPFRATFLFTDGPVALLGPHSVEVGDELLGGDAVVTRIEGRRIAISLRGIPREVELPPLRATAAGVRAATASLVEVPAVPPVAEVPVLTTPN